MNLSPQAKQSVALIPALVLALFGVLGSAHAQPCFPTPTGLVAWWPGDGNTNDIQGTNDGIPMNGVTFVDGKVGQAFSFNGSTSYVRLPDNLFPYPPLAQTGTQPFTFETWFRTTNGGVIIAQQKNDPLGAIVESAAAGLFVGSDGGLHAEMFYLGSGRHLIGTNFIVNDGAFHHAGVTYDGTTLALYLNGVLAQSRPQSTQTGYAVGYKYQLGTGYTAGVDPHGGVFPGWFSFNGQIDEPSLYNRALTAAEIQAIYAAGSSGKCSKAGLPSITSNPQSQIISFGTNLTLSATVDGTRPLFFQWRHNGTILLAGSNYFGVDSPSLSISNSQSGQLGAYSVLVTNTFGSTVSGSAILGLAETQDDDGDGIPNWWETAFGLDLNNPLDAGTKPTNESERLTFSQKHFYGLDPTALDTDGDGFSDSDELFVVGSNPAEVDTDDDGMPDKWELDHGLNPMVNDAGGDLDLDGVSNLQEYQNRARGYRPDRGDSLGDGRSDYERIFGRPATRFYYDRTDRLIGADYDRGANGFAIAYVYDGNGNLRRQKSLARDANHNGLPDLWEFLHGLTNNASPYADADGDGWTDYQEWKADTSPTNSTIRPGVPGNSGLNIASLALPFTPSNFVVAVGQLDGYGAEEIVIGADGNPGTNMNFLLVLTQTSSTWLTQQVDVGSFGVTSLAIGQPTNRPAPAIYAGLRGTTNGSGRIVEFLNVGGVWQKNAVANSTNEAAFVLGVRPGVDLSASYAVTSGAGNPLLSLSFSSNSWVPLLLNTNSASRGLGSVSDIGTNGAAALRLLDSGRIEVNRIAPPLPTNVVYQSTSGSKYFVTPTKMTWSDAEPFAQSYGGHLASIADESENVLVRNLANSVASNEDKWIGLNDAASESNFVWSSGEAVGFTNWNALQPDNSGDEDAVAMYGGTGNWYDEPASNLLFGVIEVPDAAVLPLLLPEAAASQAKNWRGLSLASGFIRSATTNAYSVFYSFGDDLSGDGILGSEDDFVTAEYLVSGTNASVLTSNRQSIASSKVAQSYGLASVNFLNSSNEVFFTGEPDGRVFAWRATGTNPMQRQLFSAQYAGKAWHVLAGVKTLEPGEGLVSLLVDPAAPTNCNVILWPPQRELPQVVSFPQTAPIARVLPNPAVGGNLANVRVRIWDAEGNVSLPLLQFSPDTTNWFDVTNIVKVDGVDYSLATRVPALPGGSEYTLAWNAGAVFPPGVTDIFLRARALDISLLGDWSEPMPYQLTITLDSDSDYLPDDWEMAAFGNLNQNENEDADRDGFSNLGEYLAGTNPTDPNSSLKLRIEPLEGAVKLSWDGGSRVDQVLQQSFAVPFVWQDVLTNPAPTAGVFTNTSFATNSFFRLRLPP